MSDAGQVIPDVSAADNRVRQVLADNKWARCLITLMAVSIFLLAAGMLVTMYWVEVPVLLLGGLALGAVLQWAMKQLMRVRRDNLILQSLPVIVRVLPPEEAAQEMMARLRSAQGAG